ncbi:MAG: dockerin type I repeat-containing protein, partial [Clostridia bacterium]|nr:dockerin type I repeat-containing protein [Clostridia bacterium]
YLADINRSGTVDNGDAALLCSHLAGTGALADKRNASVDVNGDGKVDNADLVAVLRKMR